MTMTLSEMVDKVILDAESDPSYAQKAEDIVILMCDFCNIDTDAIPSEMAVFVRRKLKAIIDYEEANGTGFKPEVSSISEGDSSITFASNSETSVCSIYGLSASDIMYLKRHRRLRGHA